MNYAQLSLDEHRRLKGKLEIVSKAPLVTRDDLSTYYTPGIAAVSEAIAADSEKSWEYTMRGNTVAVISDGSAVLGLGNIGAAAAQPVMAGKAVLFKEFADIDAFPLVLDTQDTAEIIRTVRAVALNFGGINLEDIAAPRCFEIEAVLQDLGIPVMHDDQHGTAVVVAAGLLNALRVVGKQMKNCRIVINGAGAAGTAIAQLLGEQAKEIVVLDSKGIISLDRTDLNKEKQKLAASTNPGKLNGSLTEALDGADVFIGVSKANVLSAELAQTMAKGAIVFALANPVPEIMPDEAAAAGVAVIATGRSDFPNQVNNVLAFPGIFRGALDARAKRITPHMLQAAVQALASAISEPTATCILPSPLDKTVAKAVAEAVKEAAKMAA